MPVYVPKVAPEPELEPEKDQNKEVKKDEKKEEAKKEESKKEEAKKEETEAKKTEQPGKFCFILIDRLSWFLSSYSSNLYSAMGIFCRRQIDDIFNIFPRK